MLLLASLFLTFSVTRKLKLLFRFTARYYLKGNMQSLQEQHITQSGIVKLIYVLYKGVILETTHCEGQHLFAH